ncbi:PaaI family thioesterase [Carnobacterium pleistocenium]|uniref:PaaI family thioesterase n=1 Tax=Carnobacterium pleistocenium TaxID=181073 RepID=UPI000555AB0F|nr:PaaI family thioesterase [Carnobacterium pleistocenium]
MNPRYEKRKNEKQSFLTALGGKLEQIESGKAILSLKKEEWLTQHLGYFHGGVVTALADSAGGAAAVTMVPENYQVVTSELTMHFLRPAVADEIIATAEVIKPGNLLIIVECSVTDKETGKLIAKAVGTWIPVKMEDAMFKG